MFSQVSVILSMGQGCLPYCMLGHTPPGQTPPETDTPLGQTHHPLDRHTLPLDTHPKADMRPPPPRDGHCSARYASYWNAFLFGNQNKFYQRYKATEENSKLSGVYCMARIVTV